MDSSILAYICVPALTKCYELFYLVLHLFDVITMRLKAVVRNWV